MWTTERDEEGKLDLVDGLSINATSTRRQIYPKRTAKPEALQYLNSRHRHTVAYRKPHRETNRGEPKRQIASVEAATGLELEAIRTSDGPNANIAAIFDQNSAPLTKIKPEIGTLMTGWHNRCGE